MYVKYYRNWTAFVETSEMKKDDGFLDHSVFVAHSNGNFYMKH